MVGRRARKKGRGVGATGREEREGQDKSHNNHSKTTRDKEETKPNKTIKAPKDDGKKIKINKECQT